MNNLILAARLLLGAAFVVFGANHFYPFLRMGGEAPPDLAYRFYSALMGSGYLDVVKALEIAGGFALLSKRFAPLGLLLLGPVVVNIVLYDIYLTRKFNPVGTGVAVAFTFLLLAYRRNFAAVFAAPRR